MFFADEQKRINSLIFFSHIRGLLHFASRIACSCRNCLLGIIADSLFDFEFWRDGVKEDSFFLGCHYEFIFFVVKMHGSDSLSVHILIYNSIF